MYKVSIILLPKQLTDNLVELIFIAFIMLTSLCRSLSTQNTLERLLRLFINGGRLKNDDAGSIECSYERLDDGKVSEFQQEINEKWLIQQVIVQMNWR